MASETFFRRPALPRWKSARPIHPSGPRRPPPPSGHEEPHHPQVRLAREDRTDCEPRADDLDEHAVPAALDGGADDYVGKPFSASELLARIRVALRHTARASHETDDATFKVGDLQVDLLRRRVGLGTNEVRLTPIEYKLLTTLIRHAGKVVTHQQLLRDVWGPTHTDQAHYVRVYMAHLRHKLEANPARPRYLLTEPGVGYRLAVE